MLASRSPRRAELLKNMGLSFEIMTPLVDEDISIEDPGKLARILAVKKAESVLEKIPEGIVIGADTIVYHRGKVLGKPANAREAVRMLSSLSGSTHQVFTGFTIIHVGHDRISSVEMTRVTFRTLESWEIKDYVDSGSPFDKAGAYGIQDKAFLVESIDGCYFNVIGFPVVRFYEALKQITGSSAVRNLLSMKETRKRSGR